jgi:hypothetical protein
VPRCPLKPQPIIEPPAKAQPASRTVHDLAHISSASKASGDTALAQRPGHQLLKRRSEMSLYVRNVVGTTGQSCVVKNAGKEKATEAAIVKEAVCSGSGRGSNAPAVPPQLLAQLKAYTSQLLRGSFNTLMEVIREEASVGLHICTLSPHSFCHFFRLATWFMQYCRYQEEARVASKSTTCIPNLCLQLLLDLQRDDMDVSSAAAAVLL